MHCHVFKLTQTSVCRKQCAKYIGDAHTQKAEYQICQKLWRSREHVHGKGYR